MDAFCQKCDEPFSREGEQTGILEILCSECINKMPEKEMREWFKKADYSMPRKAKVTLNPDILNDRVARAYVLAMAEDYLNSQYDDLLREKYGSFGMAQIGRFTEVAE